MDKYKATVRLKSDKKKKVFDIGDEVKPSDFPKEVIQAWLLTGDLVELEKSEKPAKSQEE